MTLTLSSRHAKVPRSRQRPWAQDEPRAAAPDAGL